MLKVKHAASSLVGAVAARPKKAAAAVSPEEQRLRLAKDMFRWAPSRKTACGCGVGRELFAVQ